MIPSGDDADAIASVLQERGVIDDAGRFGRYLKAQAEGSDFKAGTYTFQAGTGYDAIIARLNAGPTAGDARLVIPEGFRLTQIEALLPRVGINPPRLCAGRARGGAAAGLRPPPEHGGLHVPGDLPGAPARARRRRSSRSSWPRSGRRSRR